jgi:hypothetical protein
MAAKRSNNIGRITAKKLSRSGAHSLDVDEAVRQQLDIIDTRLREKQCTWGRNVIEYSLPTCFTACSLKRKDAQLVIYAAIIRSLQNRDFEVAILLDTSNGVETTTLFIAWISDVTLAEIEAINDVIRAVSITCDTVDKFISSPAPVKIEELLAEAAAAR